EWDRFHGRTGAGVPFVLSRAAQAGLFDLVDEFDDESLTFGGRRQVLGPWLEDEPKSVGSDFWTNIYENGEPGWEFGRESVVLPSVLPRLKIPRSRVLVPGCGTGHDAAFFARQGHLVTGVDFSRPALERARVQYGDLKDLRFVQADVFSLPADWT